MIFVLRELLQDFPALPSLQCVVSAISLSSTPHSDDPLNENATVEGPSADGAPTSTKPTVRSVITPPENTMWSSAQLAPFVQRLAPGQPVEGTVVPCILIVEQPAPDQSESSIFNGPIRERDFEHLTYNMADLFLIREKYACMPKYDQKGRKCVVPCTFSAIHTLKLKSHNFVIRAWILYRLLSFVPPLYPSSPPLPPPPTKFYLPSLMSKKWTGSCFVKRERYQFEFRLPYTPLLFLHYRRVESSCRLRRNVQAPSGHFRSFCGKS